MNSVGLKFLLLILSLRSDPLCYLSLIRHKIRFAMFAAYSFLHWTSYQEWIVTVCVRQKVCYVCKTNCVLNSMNSPQRINIVVSVKRAFKCEKKFP